MTKKVKDAKYAVGDVLKTVREANIKSFTIKEIIDSVKELGFTIKPGWAAECLKHYGYRFDRHHNVWIEDGEEKITVSKADYNHIVEGAEKILQRYKSTLAELDSLKAKEATKTAKNRLNAEKLKDIITNLNMRSYCKSCSKENKCSPWNRFFNKPCDFIGNASHHIVEVLKEVIKEII